MPSGAPSFRAQHGLGFFAESGEAVVGVFDGGVQARRFGHADRAVANGSVRAACDARKAGPEEVAGVILLGSLVIAGILGAAVNVSLVRPLRRMTLAVEELAHGNSGYREFLRALTLSIAKRRIIS